MRRCPPRPPHRRACRGQLQGWPAFGRPGVSSTASRAYGEPPRSIPRCGSHSYHSVGRVKTPHFLVLPCQKLGPISGPARQCNGAGSTMAGWEERFGDYVGRLGDVLGHADRRAPLRANTTGLLLPGERKSVEPMAARVDPARVGAAHQSLHHFVAKAAWDDATLLRAVRAHALPAMLERGPVRAWLVDDTGLPKKGRLSVGVARQYCGQLGKRENCQVAVTLSVATEQASLPVAYRLYLPEA